MYVRPGTYNKPTDDLNAEGGAMGCGTMDANAPATPQQWAATLSGPPALCSAASGWRGALVRRWCGTRPAIEQPRLDRHYVSLHLGGAKRLTRRGEGATVAADIKAGALSFTSAGTTYSWLTAGPVDYAHLYLESRAVDRVIREDFDRDPRTVALHDFVGGESALLSALFGGLLRELETPGATSRVLLDTLLHTMVVRLLCERSTIADTRRPAPHSLAPGRLRRVLDFIEANLERDLGLDDLAAAGGSSRFHFSRAFRDATGLPPYRYLVERRVRVAKTLLVQIEVPLAEVATRCGFNSPAQLSAMFKQVTGTTPARYRREH